MDELEPDVFREYTDTKANLNYEMLLARAVDRCLHYRTVDTRNLYFSAVHTLGLSLVDLPGKPLQSEFDLWVSKDENHLYRESEFAGHVDAAVAVTDAAFKEITRILAKYHMLFKSTMIEANR